MSFNATSTDYVENPTRLAAEVACNAVYGVFWAVSTTLFVLRRNREPIKSRQWHLTLVSTFAGMFYWTFGTTTGAPVVFAAANPTTLCHTIIWIASLFLPFFAYPPFFRAYVLFFQYFYSSGIIKRQSTLTATSAAMATRGTARWWLTRLRASRTVGATMLMWAIFVVINIVIIAAMDFGIDVPLGVCAADFDYLFTAQGLLAFATVIVFIGLLWPVKDAFGFKFELIMIVVTQIPIFILFASMLLLGEPLWPYFASGDVGCISIFAMQCVTVVMPLVWSYQEERLAAIELLKKDRFVWDNPEVMQRLGLDLTRRSSVDEARPSSKAPSRRGSANDARMDPEQFLRAALRNPILLASLQTFAVQSWCVENIVFWLDLQTVREDAKTASNDDIAAQIKRIYRTYIADNAEMQLNLDQDVREGIKQAVEQLDGDANAHPSATIFDNVEAIVIHDIALDTLRKWNSSQLCATAINELLSRERSASIDMSVSDMRSRVAAAGMAQRDSSQHELLPLS